MFRRPGFNDGFNMRGPQPNFGQREILGGGHHQDPGGNRVANAAKLLSYVQLNDRENWLLQLGANRYLAHKLAVESLESPEFNLQHLQQRWRRVCEVMGPNRQAETNIIVLREIQDLLRQRECPRTPTPPRDIHWNKNWGNTSQPDCYESPIGYSGPTAADRYEFQGMTSTPLFDRNRNLPDRQSSESDFYNIDNDPRNMEENYAREQPRPFTPNYSNENNDNGPYQENDVYNINEDPRNFRIQQPNYTEYRNNENYMNYREVFIDQDFRNMADIYSRRQSQNFTEYNSNEWNDNMRYHKVDDYNSNDFRNVNTHYTDDRINTNITRNIHSHDPYSREEQQPRNLNHRGDGPISRNFRGDFNNRQTRKRNAEPEVRDQRKRRYVEPRITPKPFQIGDFEMPCLRHGNDPLPQPEHKSYAIKFYQRKHAFIIGGPSAVPKALAPKESPVAKSTNMTRNALKQFRRNLRVSWMKIDSTKRYSNWYLWWKDYKWCEKAIDKELERFTGVNVKEIHLRYKLNYGKERSVDKLINMAKMSFELNANNYQSIIATIFELMNVEFLEKLRTMQMETLQNLIRYLPNFWWISKMRGMVYLWSRYSQIQSEDVPLSDGKMATETQWNSPLFHWLGKQAYAELQLISQIEWKDHDKMYSSIYSSPTNVN
ncbi:hypothetical protein ACLKA7_004232 [Drosophila subpalustris]